MTLFRLFLLCLIGGITGYTLVTIAGHGMDFLPVFFGDMAKMGWPGQFNLDFLSFLMLGGLWLAWRHHFSIAGIALGLLIFAGGMPFFATYLLIQSFKTGGDVSALLLGETRAKPM